MSLSENFRIGDLVEINYNGTLFRTMIDSIENSTLILFHKKTNSRSSIKWNGVNWLLPDNTIVYPNFIKSIKSEREERFPFFKLPLEVKLNLLINATDKEFESICSMPELDDLCNQKPNSERIYKERCENKFIDSVLELKPQNMKWKEFYNIVNPVIQEIDAINNTVKRSTTINNAENIARRVIEFNEAMDNIIAGHDIKKVLNVTKFDVETGKGVFREDAPSAHSIMIWPHIVVNGVTRKIPIIVHSTALQNLGDYLDLVVRKSRYSNFVNDIWSAANSSSGGYITQAMKYQNLVLKYINNNNNLLELKVLNIFNPDTFRKSTVIDLIILLKKYDILKWMIYDLEIDYIPNEFTAYIIAYTNTDLDLLKWIYEVTGKLPDIDNANKIAKLGDIGTLVWLEEKGVLPNYQGANNAIFVKNRAVLDWLAERNIFPDDYGEVWLQQNPF